MQSKLNQLPAPPPLRPRTTRPVSLPTSARPTLLIQYTLPDAAIFLLVAKKVWKFSSEKNEGRPPGI